MEFDAFIRAVRDRSDLNSGMETVEAIRAAFVPLGQRLSGDHTSALARHLPFELGAYFRKVVNVEENFSVEEYFERVANLEDIDRARAVRHAEAVLSILRETVPAGKLREVKAGLPVEWEDLLNGRRSRPADAS